MRVIEKVIFAIEMTIAALLGVGIVISLWDLVKYYADILVSHQSVSYSLFQAFLGHALLLVVGVELILMILHHSTKAILELVLFVIARKMLVYTNSMSDLVFGTVSIAILFVVLRFVVLDDTKTTVRRESIKLPSFAEVKDIRSKTGFNLPTDKGTTLGSLVCSLADEACRPVEENAEFTAGDIRIKIAKATKDGVVEEVIITHDTEEKKKERFSFEGKKVTLS